MIESTRSDYNAALNRRVYGYQETDGWFRIGGTYLIGGDQTRTTQEIDPTLKAYLDQALLENKIPDAFDEVAVFQRLIRQAHILAK